jgi:hypothetical protein
MERMYSDFIRCYSGVGNSIIGYVTISIKSNDQMMWQAEHRNHPPKKSDLSQAA